MDFETVTAANEYGFYCIPKEYLGRKMASSLAAGHVYEPMTLRFIQRHLGAHDIVSGGAFIGDFFPAICEKMTAKAKLHSFEPTPMSFDAARETVRLNGLRNVSLSPVAIGQEAGKVALQIARKSGAKIAAGERVVSDQEVDNERVLEVEVKPIDSIVPKTRKVSLLHLDVEGYEEQALRGAVRVINDGKPLVILEAGKPWKERNFLRILNEICGGPAYEFMGAMENNAIYRAM